MRARVVRLVAFVVLAAIAYVLGDGVFARMSVRPGWDLVAFDDVPSVKGPSPAHVVIVVIDGLGAQDALRVSTIDRLATRWPCLTIDVGPISLSRPGYACLSTGLESDRNGCRTNSDTRPLAADSIWQEARRAGRLVVGASEVDWWRQLFPDGFDRFFVGTSRDDLFATTEIAPFTLIHPGYVDDTAHDHGVLGPDFEAALHRVDHELEELLARVDLDRDVLLVTADHGHVARGGHGGRGARESFTRACFVGAGVRPTSRGDLASITLLAPTISMLSGLPLPRTLRASSDRADDLDLAVDLLDPNRMPAGWIDDRRAAIARARSINPARGTLENQAKSRQRAKIVVALVAALALVALGVRRRERALFSATWIVSSWLLALGALGLVHRALDLSAVKSSRSSFIAESAIVVACVVVAAVVVHLFVRRDRRALADELLLAVGVGASLEVAQPILFGWHLDPPIPDARVVFFPVLAAIVTLAFAVAGVVFVVVDASQTK